MPAPSLQQPHCPATIQGLIDRAGGGANFGTAEARACLGAVDDELAQRFEQGASGWELVALRARVCDAVLSRLWRDRAPPPLRAQSALVAVGGYGRGELHPGSDVDLSLLLPAQAIDTEPVQAFVTELWDLGVDIGASVRTVAQSAAAARDDITVMTTLLEHRLLVGDGALLAAINHAIRDADIWPSHAFFAAKMAEQAQRRQRFHDSAYRLEPNVKESPGGLRDLQTIGWVVNRHFGERHLSELSEHRFLSADEVQTLRECRDFLWRVRFVLHRLAGRAEDRLLFEHQRALAAAFGVMDRDQNAAVERFMQQYYRVVTETVRLNEMLLQLFQERIIDAGKSQHIAPVNERFAVIDGYLAATDEAVFKRYPPALIEIFVIGCQVQGERELLGIRASTVRLIRQHLYLIDSHFRADLIVRSLFIELFSQPAGLSHQLARMNRFGVLAAYLPNFESIVGRMQFDLFHIYTVDEHTLKVVRNLRQFAVPEHAEQHPDCTALMASLAHPSLLYIMGLMHDVAKGRGGDHCELGAEDTRAFCQAHGLRHSHTELAVWGVRNHLLMSTVAQRRDIYDPDVVRDFAGECRTAERLNYLYLLTVADICGTDPALWTDWKANLLATLYRHTREMIEAGFDEAAATRAEQIEQRQREAQQLLSGRRLAAETVAAFWSALGEEYFLRFTPEEIAWHSGELASAGELVGDTLRAAIRTNAAGSTELAIYAPSHPMLFANLTSRMALQGLDIVDARLVATPVGHTLQSFTLLDERGEALHDANRVQRLLQSLREHREPPSMDGYRRSRQQRAFQLAPQVAFDTEDAGAHTSVLVTAADSPGILAAIARAFLQTGSVLHAAKISTFGEKAEDVFYISDADGNAIDDSVQLTTIRRALIEHLSELESDD